MAVFSTGLVQECDEGHEQADACDRPPISRKQLPRHAAEASGAATPGSLGPLPFAHFGLWPPPFCAVPTLVREYLFAWQLGRSLFGMPARVRVVPFLRLDGSGVAALLSCRGNSLPAWDCQRHD